MRFEGRLFLSGYQVGEYPITLAPVSNDVSIRVKDPNPSPLSTAAVSLFHVVSPATGLPDVVPFYPDTAETRGMIASVCHRFGRAMPARDDATSRDFLLFARRFISTRFIPVCDTDVMSFEEQLTHSSYTGGRKRALAELAQTICRSDLEHLKNKSFLKHEGHQEPKYPRAINSYTDESKVILLAVCHAIDKATFSTRTKDGRRIFVKGTHPRTWPSLLEETLGNEPVTETDFSSFEATHQGVMSDVIHFWFMHMLRNTSLPPRVIRYISTLVRGENVCVFKKITARLPRRLMSGALWTSSSNGVLNLLILSYLCGRTLLPTISPEELADRHEEFFRGHVEGDDAIARDVGVTADLIARMGINLKLERHGHFSEAKFCGIVCDPGEMACVMDPRKILRNFWWLPPRYKHARPSVLMSLHRAKALSYLTLNPHSPIIGPMCHRICELTAGHDVRAISTELEPHKRLLVAAALEERVWEITPCPTPAMRRIVEERFGVSIAQQIDIEGAFARGDGRFVIDLSFLASRDDCVQAANHVHLASPCGLLGLPTPHVPPLIQEIIQRGLEPTVAQPRRDRLERQRFAAGDAVIVA